VGATKLIRGAKEKVKGDGADNLGPSRLLRDQFSADDNPGDLELSAAERRYLARRRKAIDAAASVFAGKGYHGASLRDIGDRLLIHQASLYHYFSDKEAALAIVCLVGVSGFVTNLSRIVKIDCSAAEKIMLAIQSHLAPLRDRADHMRVFLSQRKFLTGEYRLRIRKMADEYEALVERIFLEGVAKGEMRTNLNCRLSALTMIGLCNSAVDWYGRESGLDIDIVADEFAYCLIGGTILNREMVWQRASSSPKRGKKPDGRKSAAPV
jgi:AcrR family transcriptional regulator